MRAIHESGGDFENLSDTLELKRVHPIKEVPGDLHGFQPVHKRTTDDGVMHK